MKDLTATELAPGEDGKRGEMSLCPQCWGKLMEKSPWQCFFKPIIPEKKPVQNCSRCKGTGINMASTEAECCAPCQGTGRKLLAKGIL